MNKLKENILFALISLTIFTTCFTAFDFFYRDEIDIVRSITTSGIITIAFLLDRKYKFSAKITRMLTFIK